MKLTFDISATEFVTVRDILADIVPTECRVWVFGSRAKNQARFNSDLDLALECKDKLPPIILHKLKEAFSDSRLPYRVDVLDINDVSENFQTIIRPQAIAFPLAKSDKVPALRFSEFSGEWSHEPVKELAEVKTGSRDTQNRILDGKYPFYVRSDTIERINSFAFDGEAILTSGDGVGVGKNIHYVSGKFDFHQRVYAIYKFKDDLFGPFFFQFFKENFFRHVMRLSAKNSVDSVRMSMITDMLVPAPTLPEQQKIASFLSAIDTKIEQLTKKKALLEQYKRGVMQKLFSQELRFKDAQGKAFPDWEKRELADILDYQQPTPYLVASAEYDDSYTTPVLTAGKTFLLGYTNETTGIFEKNLPTIIFDDFTTAFKYVDFPFKAKSSAMKMLMPKNIGVNLRFVHAAMNLIRFPLGEHKRYWISEYQWETIGYPCPSEQKKIANFISSIDRKIDLVTTELDHAKTFKKGLLQQMFV